MPESITYNRRTLYEELSEVQGYLAELRYIDTAMVYMEEEKASWWHSAPLVGPGTSYIEVEFGRTFPFKKYYEVPEEYIRFFWQDSKKTEVEDQLQVLAERADSWAAAEIETITAWIEPFTWPVGSLYEGHCIEPVIAVHQRLEDEISADFGRLSHSLGNWEGDAADNFASFFYNPFEATLRSQKQLLLALAGGIASAKAIAESTQHSIMNVVHYTREALLEQLELCAATAELARQESIRNTLIIAGGAATVFAGIASGGTLWVVTLSAVAGGASIASTTIPDGGWIPLDLHGASATELADALFHAIRDIRNNDGDQHEALMDEVTTVLERVETLRGGSDDEDGRLIPVRPNIVDGVDGSDFHLP